MRNIVQETRVMERKFVYLSTSYNQMRAENKRLKAELKKRKNITKHPKIKQTTTKWYSNESDWD